MSFRLARLWIVLLLATVVPLLVVPDLSAGDSRDPFAAQQPIEPPITVTFPARTVVAGDLTTAVVTVRNSGNATWQPALLRARVELVDATGLVIATGDAADSVQMQPVKVGELADFAVYLAIPEDAPSPLGYKASVEYDSAPLAEASDHDQLTILPAERSQPATRRVTSGMRGLAGPVVPEAGQRVDLVFAMDTSGSMDDEFNALCNTINSVVQEMQARGVTLNYRILGIRYTRSCASDTVSGLIPGGLVNHEEDWGPATSDLSNSYPWQPGYVKLIVPVSDEGPQDGDSCRDPGNDRDSIVTAIADARRANVRVSPILGTIYSSSQSACITRLAEDLADGTGGRLFYSSNPDQDIADGLIQLVGGAVNRSFITVNPDQVAVGGTATVTVTIRDQDNQLAPGRSVRLASSRSGDTFAAQQGITNAQGQFVTTITSQTSGVSTLSAHDLTVNEPVVGTARVTFGSVSNPPSAAPRIVDVTSDTQLGGLYAQGLGDLFSDVRTTIDWQGGEPGAVEYALNDVTVATISATGSSVVHAVNFGSLKIGGNVLRIIARNSVGQDIRTYVLTGWGIPHWLSSATNGFLTRSHIEIEASIPKEQFGMETEWLFPSRSTSSNLNLDVKLKVPLAGGPWTAEVGGHIPGSERLFKPDFKVLGMKIKGLEGELRFGGAVSLSGLNLSQFGIGVGVDIASIELFKENILVVLIALPPAGPAIHAALVKIPPVVEIFDRVAYAAVEIKPKFAGNFDADWSNDPTVYQGGLELAGDFDVIFSALNGATEVYAGLGPKGEILHNTGLGGLCFRAELEGHAGYRVHILLWDQSEEFAVKLAEFESEHCPAGLRVVRTEEMVVINSRPWHIPRGDFGPSYTTLVGAKPAMFNELNLTGPDAINAAFSDALLFSNVYANAKPSLAWAPDGSAGMIVWTHDDPAKLAGQGLEVVSSYFDGAGWSALTKITNDTYPDTGARVTRLSDGRFLAVWERVNDPALSPSAPFDATSWSRTEIMGAIFNPTTRSWSSPVPLQAANTVLDYEPQLAANDSGAAMATWRHNAGNELVGTVAHPDELRYARFDGTAWTAGTVATALVNMGQTSLAYGASSATVAWSQTITPTGVITGTDQIFTSTFNGTGWSSPLQVTSGEPGHGSAQAFYTPTGTPAVAWIQDGQIAWRTLPSGPIQVTNIAQNAHEFQFAANPGGDMVATWSESDDIYISLYDWADNLWSAPANLTNDIDRETYLGPVFEDTGMLRIGYADTAITEEERSATTATGEVITYTARIEGQTNLNLLSLSPYSNLTIGEMTVTPDSGGTTADIVVDVANTGYFAADPVSVELYDGNPNAGGVLIDSLTLPVPLAAGITETVTMTHTIDPTAGLRTFWTVVDPAQNVPEADEGDNVSSLRGLGPDVYLESTLALYAAGSMVDFETTVVNGGTAASGPATIAYYRDTVGGSPLATSSVPALNPGEQVTVLTSWDYGNLAAGTYPLIAVVNQAEADFAELDLANNEFTLALEVAADLVIDPLYFESEPGSNRSVVMRTTVFNFGRVAANNVPVVFYQTAGSGLTPVGSTSIATIPAGGSAVATAVWSSPPSEFSLTAIIDPNDQLNESRRDNNAASLIPGFQMTADPRQVVVSAGQTTAVTVNISSVAGFNDMVSIEALDLPVGAVASVIPTTVTPPGSVTLQLTIPESADPAVYPVRVVGTSGNLSATAIVEVDVRTPVGPQSTWAALPIVTKPDVVHTPTSEPLTNGNFERGPDGSWTEYSTHGWDIILEQSTFPGDFVAHSGTWAAWLGGAYNEISLIEQDVTIPATAPYLTYWHWIASEDYCGYDFGGVLIDNSTVVDAYDLCTNTSTNGWVRHVVDLRSYAGQTVDIQIRSETDGSLNSNLFVDDVSFQSSSTVRSSAGNMPDWTPAITTKHNHLISSESPDLLVERLLSNGDRSHRQHPAKGGRR